MTASPHQVLSTREARARLPGMLKVFRQAGLKAQDIVIGSHRKPEAVVISYARYQQLMDILADQEMRVIAEQRLAAGSRSERVDLDEIERELALDAGHVR